jgi:pimeloyl-ACP methyl ester carboxylesterase
MAEIQINDTLYYYDISGSSSETIVLAHGFLTDSEVFRNQVEYFRKKYRVITFDWRGQGKSQITRGGYEMDMLFEDAAGLLEKLDCKPCHWAGISMAGFIGLRLAARRPDLIKSLALVDTSDEAETTLKKIRWGLLAYIFKYFGPGAVTKGIQKVLFGKSSLENPDFKQVLDEYAGKWRTLDRKTTFEIAWAIFNRPAVTDELPLIKIPTIIIVGDEDVARPLEEARRMQKRIPESRLEIVPHAGHTVPLEQPEYFNRIYENFLESVN